jgi:glycosyltransferase involved in cell wall biosynthesis
MADPVWFWQRIVSPHMVELAVALTAQRQVTYVAERIMSADRAMQGWQAPSVDGVHLRLVPDAEAVKKLVAEAPANSIHICQGFRGNGLVDIARKALTWRGLRQWVIMETIEDGGWRGALRRLEYRRLVHRWRGRIEGVLAIGDTTSNWLVARGMPGERIFPFAYFLPDRMQEVSPCFEADAPFRFLYVGRLIELKRVDLLLDALARLGNTGFELIVVGSGPLDAELRVKAEEKLPQRVRWLGLRPIGEISALMADADCLVLPSRYDGWGAVVSEALMVGTPAICSDNCGAAGAVRASGWGGVFASGNVEALAGLLRDAIAEGRQTPEQRSALADWGRCLGAGAGARYLNAILSYIADTAALSEPIAPWISSERIGAAAA